MKNILANNRYKVCSGWKAAELIKKGMQEYHTPLSYEQERALKNFFGDMGMLGNLEMPFQLYTWEEEKVAGCFLWRLTVPFFFLASFLYIITIHPIHWIVTGKEALDHNNWFAKVVSAWDNKIFKKTFNSHRTA